jgi:PPOX class probable F420-dependent enzyme
MSSPYHQLVHLGFVDEQLGLECLDNAKLDGLFADRGHDDLAALGERSEELDLLDVPVPFWPPGHVRPQPPNLFRRNARLDAVRRLTYSRRGMRKGLAPDELDGLLERPLVAVLATYRASGDVLLSPVWHRWRDDGFDVVSRGDDVKVRHLRNDPRATILVYEHEPPYRGIELKGRAVLGPADPDLPREMAVRYMGTEMGETYAASAPDDTLIRLEPGHIRAWDFADDL